MLICTLVNIFTLILAMYNLILFKIDIITLMSIYHMYFSFNIFSIILCLQFEIHITLILLQFIDWTIFLHMFNFCFSNIFQINLY